MPQTARDPCALYTLPTDRPPTAFDLEIGYATRGAQVVGCDGKRDLAVKTADAEHELEDQWAAERACRARPWLKRLWPC